jgi:hypothetical protein
MDDTSFSQDDVFPIIRRVIRNIYQDKQDWVTHDEIVQGLLSDPAGQKEIRGAQKSRPGETEKQIAANMVAWFSQRITVDKLSADARSFVREKIHNKWAYRPKAGDITIPAHSSRSSATAPSVSSQTALAAEFDRAIRYRYSAEIPAATGYRPARMLEMIDKYGGLDTVRRLKMQYEDFASEGYTRLWEFRRLDLSFEALMHDPRFASLFTDEERAWACKRLAEYQYIPPGGCV